MSDKSMDRAGTSRDKGGKAGTTMDKEGTPRDKAGASMGNQRQGRDNQGKYVRDMNEESGQPEENRECRTI